ncbi:HupE/UreJ family protein [Paraglaciecola sp.]|uniref:HupE/UreJ family protein n=1 Tax=Paraglaciecola sp. TaxID=1920173 RepID=UPI0032674416
MWNRLTKFSIYFLLCFIIASDTFAHGVTQQDQGFLAGASGIHLVPYLYLGAKHMVTGYDHLLYLAGVIFFLGRLKEVVLFVSLFAIGHSLTLLTGVLSGIHINPYLIDAIIGLSVCYKALENLGTIQLLNPKFMVFTFGLVHGFGLSSKLQDISISSDGLIANMLAFNLGVEVGQVIALTFLFWLFTWLRNQHHFVAIASTTNTLLFSAGLILFGFQSVGYFLQ